MNEPRLSRRLFLNRLNSAALAAAVFDNRFAHGATQRTPRVLFISRAGVYEPEIVRRERGKPSASERRMADIGKRIGVDIDCQTDCSVFDGDLDRYDAFVLFWNFDPMKPNARGEPPITARGKARLIEAVAAGKGVVGIHCAAFAFLSGKQEESQSLENRDPYTRMLGGELCGCLAKQPCQYRIVSPGFPGIDQLKTPTVRLNDEPYGLKNFADDIHVIALMETDGLDTLQRKDKTFPRPPFPCIWARHHGKGRVFYMSMGHDEETWQTTPFETILQGGLNWAIGRVDADLMPNLSRTAPEAQAIPTH